MPAPREVPPVRKILFTNFSLPNTKIFKKSFPTNPKPKPKPHPSIGLHPNLLSVSRWGWPKAHIKPLSLLFHRAAGGQIYRFYPTVHSRVSHTDHFTPGTPFALLPPIRHKSVFRHQVLAIWVPKNFFPTVKKNCLRWILRGEIVPTDVGYWPWVGKCVIIVS